MRFTVSPHAQHATVYGRRIRNTPNGKRCCKVRLGRCTLVWAGPIFWMVTR